MAHFWLEELETIEEGGIPVNGEGKGRNGEEKENKKNGECLGFYLYEASSNIVACEKYLKK